ncbi:unnamed protein product, partial [Bubo scandiacus]
WEKKVLRMIFSRDFSAGQLKEVMLHAASCNVLLSAGAQTHSEKDFVKPLALMG